MPTFIQSWLNNLANYGLPSTHKTIVWHSYNVGTTSTTLDRRCINSIQMFCVWINVVLNKCRLRPFLFTYRPIGSYSLNWQANRGWSLWIRGHCIPSQYIFSFEWVEINIMFHRSPDTQSGGRTPWGYELPSSTPYVIIHTVLYVSRYCYVINTFRSM